MPNPPNLGGVVGTDNVAPVYDPYGRWQEWNMDELYLGGPGANKYVPKIKDVAVEIVGTTITKYIVQDINPATMVPVFAKADEVTDAGALSQNEIILGVGPGVSSETALLYVDKSVSPYRIAVDATIYVRGSMNRWCKIFKGADLSDTGKVISKIYDASGRFVSENIPLELAETELTTNISNKVPSAAFTTEDLSDGELVTMVVYSDTGNVTRRQQLLVQNTAFIRSTNAHKKYITNISLESPFLSTTKDNLIEFPLNVPVSSLNLTCVVTYSNGDVRRYPVNGTKAQIYGFEDYVATQPGYTMNLVLRYNLAEDEVNYTAVANANDSFIPVMYKATTLAADGTYGVKLYVCPVWQNSVSGYRLEWYLYNLDRNIYYEVTPYVTINTNVSVYNPTAYGQLQRLSVSINLKNVNGAYKDYVHTQILDIIIERQGTERVTNWSIGYTTNQTPRYGIDTYAGAKFIGVNNYELNLSCGLVTKAAWLAKVYEPLMPLYNPATEVRPPVPTHFAIIYNGIRTEYPIDNWNSQLQLSTNVKDSSVVWVQFFRRLGAIDLQLAAGGLPVWYVDANNTILNQTA